MILLVHMLLGALIGEKIINPFLAVVLAFLCHYLLDLIPHAEYSIENITEKKWKKAWPDILRVTLDFCAGILLIFLFSKNNPIIYVCAFFAILPDGFSVLNLIFESKLLARHRKFHHDKLHFLKNKKISAFWRIGSQVIVSLIFIYFLKF